MQMFVQFILFVGLAFVVHVHTRSLASIEVNPLPNTNLWSDIQQISLVVRSFFYRETNRKGPDQKLAKSFVIPILDIAVAFLRYKIHLK